MEGVAAPAEAPPQHPDCAAVSPPACRLQEPGASGRLGPPADHDSDVTESADSEEDVATPPLTWALRRSSSSSVHSGEDADPDALETKLFMKRYVEKVFHGR